MGRLASWFDRSFSERQFFYRSQGNVRYLSLGKGKQVSLLFLFALVLGWLAYTSLNFVFKDQIIEAKNRRISNLVAERDELAGELDHTRQQFAVVSGELTDQYDQLKSLIEQKRQLAEHLDAVSGRLEKAEHGHAEEKKKNAALETRLQGLDEKLKTATHNHSMAQSELGMTKSQAEAVVKERDRLASRASKLEDHLDVIRTSQHELISRIHEQTLATLVDLEETVTLTGLDIDELAEDAKALPSAQGGPFVNLSDARSEIDEPGLIDEDFENSVSQLELQLSRWSGLQSVLQHMPLARPTEIGYVSSRFGARKDPFTKKRAMHYGVDIAAPRNTPVFSTAAGIVRFAGSKGAYGYSVEVDHGLGFRTRYSHLRKILVKRGQKVSFRQKVGLMGNTGRSTGPHVHYEVIYKSKMRDPAKFFKAGNYVFKAAAKEENQ